MLPTYQRVGSGGSGSGSGTGGTGSVANPLLGRRSFRSREKCLILLVLSTFGFVCFGGFFFLPDNFSADQVLKAYKQLKRAGPEIFIPAPPPAHGRGAGEEDVHRQDDRVKLAEKIRKELPDDFLEKPDTGGGDDDGGGGGGGVGEEAEGGDQQLAKGGGAIDEPERQGNRLPGAAAGPAIEGPDGVVQPPQHGPDGQQQEEEEQQQQEADGERKRDKRPVGPPAAGTVFNASVGEDPDRSVREKRNKVKEVGANTT
uniref:Uncharacterized protein n=1 Tax=Anopheles epiroticus TaxID=199890 RepID=A0A182P7X4_9DIPT